MPRKLSLALALIAAIFLFLVIMTGLNNPSWDKKISTGELYFPELKDKINEVSLIKISQMQEHYYHRYIAALNKILHLQNSDFLDAVLQTNALFEF